MANASDKDKTKNSGEHTANTSDYRAAAADDLRRRLDETEKALGMRGETDVESIAETDGISERAATVTNAVRETTEVGEVAEYLHALGVEKRKAAAIARACGVKLDEPAMYSLGLAVRYAAGLGVSSRSGKNNIHGGHRKRLREAASSDRELDSFSDIEILETLLSFVIPQRNTNPTAHALLDKFGSLLGVFRAPENALFEVSGMTRTAARLLPMLTAICLWNGTREIRINGHADAACFFGSVYLGGALAGTNAAYLDGGFGLIAVERLFAGLNDLRPIIGSVCKYSAKYVIISRRESGLFPSQFESVENIDRLKRALDAIDVRLLDCMVFSDYGYYTLGASAASDGETPEYLFVPMYVASHAPELVYKLFDEDKDP